MQTRSSWWGCSTVRLASSHLQTPRFRLPASHSLFPALLRGASLCPSWMNPEGMRRVHCPMHRASAVPWTLASLRLVFAPVHHHCGDQHQWQPPAQMAVTELWRLRVCYVEGPLLGVQLYWFHCSQLFDLAPLRLDSANHHSLALMHFFQVASGRHVDDPARGCSTERRCEEKALGSTALEAASQP